MSINNILNFFSPKNDSFFPMLNEAVEIAKNSSDLLIEVFNTENTIVRENIFKDIKALESKGDKITQTITKKLEKTFITPFDREDIHAITEKIETIIDHIHHCSQKVHLYSPAQIPPQSQKMSHIINLEVIELTKAVLNLNILKKQPAKIKDCCKQIKVLESEADTVYQQAIVDIITSDIGAVEIIKQKEIIQELEETANSVYFASMTLKNIIIKYS